MADDNQDKKQKAPLKSPFNSPNPQKGKPKFNFFWIYGILAALLLGLMTIGGGSSAEETDWGTNQSNAHQW
jgi:hypothetical protein